MMMFVECHNAQVLQKWSANSGHLLNGVVLVEFTLRDDVTGPRGLRSRLVEHVSLRTDPRFSDQRQSRGLVRRAIQQVQRYFDGDGGHENVFSDDAGLAPDAMLSPEDEAELEAELRTIEREFTAV